MRGLGARGRAVRATLGRARGRDCAPIATAGPNSQWFGALAPRELSRLLPVEGSVGAHPGRAGGHGPRARLLPVTAAWLSRRPGCPARLRPPAGRAGRRAQQTTLLGVLRTAVLALERAGPTRRERGAIAEYACLCCVSGLAARYRSVCRLSRGPPSRLRAQGRSTQRASASEIVPAFAIVVGLGVLISAGHCWDAGPRMPIGEAVYWRLSRNAEAVGSCRQSRLGLAVGLRAGLRLVGTLLKCVA